jgi:PAS domain S-box-containing protein
MNARMHQFESAAGAGSPLRLEGKRDVELRLVEDREWTEAFLAGERRILEMIAKGEALVPILDAMCRLVEEMSSGSLATILLLDADGKRLRHAAAPSLPASYIAGMGAIPVGPSVGSCGTAVHRREPVIVTDIATDPLWINYRDLPLAHGLRASWSTPIFSSEGCVMGTFAILSREPRSPAPLHHHIIEQITHLAAVAIEREHTELALRQSEERFRRMADAIPEVIWFTALKPEKVLYVSPSFERIWGLPVKDLYQNPRLWIEAIHPDDRERVTRTFTSWVAAGQVSYHNVEYRIVQPGGSIRWIHERGVLGLNEQGKPCLASGISTDVTERKRAEEELQRSEAYLAEAQRLSLTGSFGWRVASGELVWSAETLCILGYDRSVAPTLELVFKRVHPDDIAFVRQMLDRASREGTDLNFEHRVLMPDGSIKHLHIVARPSRTGTGEVEFVGAVMDITGRKRAAEALHASERLARGQVEALTRTLDALAMESVPDRLPEHVLQTITEQLNAHSSSVWRRDEAGDRMIFEFAFESGRLVTKSDTVIGAVDPSLPIKDIWPWSEVFRTGKPSVLEDIRQGPVFPWRDHLLAQGVITILVVPMLVAGQAAGVIGIRFTRQRAFRAEEMELAQALANQAMLAIQLTRLSAQSRQSAVIAERNRMARDIHDTLAQGFTGVILQLEAVEEATSQKLAAKAGEHLTRAGQLAREGLQEARRSVQALRPQSLEEKDLCEALRGLIQKLTAGTPVRAEFIVQGQPRELPPEWEENLLRIGQEVLTNVLRHAQATQFNAQLAFDDGEIRLNLRDNGSGFDPAGRHDGFGLQGMRERVEGMGGQLSIQSAKGAGTAISIVLPLANAFNLAA